MKIIVLIPFIDKKSGVFYKADMVYEASEKRLRELSDKGFVKITEKDKSTKEK